ncbi:MAG: 3'-5' exoribonuclease [Gammaproteobacteria bacterium]|nr:MAG: 3'-5' exoribonuclease [Gammaproteobacteria bacterium]
MNNVMLDLETMATGSHAAIVAIGAVEFDKDGLGREFYQTIDLDSSAAFGDISAKTVVWWMKQSDVARAEIFNANCTLYGALIEFSRWLHEGTKVWGNGVDFDNVILTNAYDDFGVQLPWSYKDSRCYRTVVAMHPKLNIKRLGVHHNALDDAIYQANHLIAIGVFRNDNI